jgi:hypothetical protein
MQVYVGLDLGIDTVTEDSDTLAVATRDSERCKPKTKDNEALNLLT